MTKPIIFGIKINDYDNWGLYIDDVYILGNYEQYEDADQAVLDLYTILDAAKSEPVHIPSKELGIPFLFGYAAADALTQLGLTQASQYKVNWHIYFKLR